MVNSKTCLGQRCWWCICMVIPEAKICYIPVSWFLMAQVTFVVWHTEAYCTSMARWPPSRSKKVSLTVSPYNFSCFFCNHHEGNVRRNNVGGGSGSGAHTADVRFPDPTLMLWQKKRMRSGPRRFGAQGETLQSTCLAQNFKWFRTADDCFQWKKPVSEQPNKSTQQTKAKGWYEISWLSQMWL